MIEKEQKIKTHNYELREQIKRLESELVLERRTHAATSSATQFELKQKILNLQNELKKEKSISSESQLTISTLKGKYDQSNKQVLKLSSKYELVKKDLIETREVIKLYEGLMSKMTE